MAMLQVVLILGVLALVLVGTLRLVNPPDEGRRPAATTRGRWRVGHYDVEAGTQVVLQKVSEGDATVLDEHVIATISTADPEYDEKFLAAMSIARQRQALFESEDGG
jgi:hypothetical protein